MDEFFNKINFPYEDVRKGQDDFIRQVFNSIEKKENIMVSAPTGLGKTVSGLAPALYKAKQNNLSVIVLTSRQTQANQVIKTIKDINSKLQENPNIKQKDKEINYLAFIGKRNMCVHSQRDLYPPQDFNDFCKKMKETGKCKHYKNVKNSDLEPQIKEILDISSRDFFNVEGFVNLAGSNNFCPYELAAKKAYKADVIICDYNYLFASGIKENFFGKIGRDLNECILIIDEAHNLPDRVRSSHTHKLNSEIIRNALSELKDFVKEKEFDPYIQNLQSTIDDIYFDKVLGEKTEYIMTRAEFLDKYMSKFNDTISLRDIIEKLFDISRLVKEQRVISFIGRVAAFMDKWHDLDEESYLRILEKKVLRDKTVLSLEIKCIDSSELASDVINNSYSTIIMSATLSPINMYKDILGVKKLTTLELDSPFAKKNQMTLVFDDVTTKYTHRTQDMFNKYASHITNLLVTLEDKNAIIFFPSYDLLEKISFCIDTKNLLRKVLKEKRYMTKEEKEEYVEIFKGEKETVSEKSKVLFAVTSGSFAEGLDLPQEMLELVIVVGLPLGMPDLFTKSVIAHFDKKFKKGQMYGYINPAMNKIIQAAGRCIRTETDKGIVALMDNRFMWTIYAQNFPKHWKMERVANTDYKIKIGNFFD